MKLHIRAMAKPAKKTPISSHVEAPGRTVIYRGIKIIPMTGKRSALAEAIREGLWSKSERRPGDTAEA